MTNCPERNLLGTATDDTFTEGLFSFSQGDRGVAQTLVKGAEFLDLDARQGDHANPPPPPPEHGGIRPDAPPEKIRKADDQPSAKGPLEAPPPPPPNSRDLPVSKP